MDHYLAQEEISSGDLFWSLPDHFAAGDVLAKESIAMRRRMAGWTTDYLAQVLGLKGI